MNVLSVGSIVPASPPAQAEAGALLLVDLFLFVAGTVALLGVILHAVRRRKISTNIPEPITANRWNEESIIVPVVAYFTTFALTGWLMGVQDAQDGTALQRLVPALAAQIVGAATCAIVIHRVSLGGFRSVLSPARSPNRSFRVAGIGLLIAVGFCPLLLALSIGIIRCVAPTYEFQPHATFAALQKGQPFALALGFWAGAVAFAPIAEELFFRGVVQTALFNLTRRRFFPILATSAMFALVHFQQPYALAPLIALSILLGITYEMTGRLWIPVFIHSAFNLKMMLWNAWTST